VDSAAERLRQLITGIRAVLDPFGHAADRERAAERWQVGDSEVVTEWFGVLLRHCKGRWRCYETRRCAYHDSPELAARNYKVCESLFLEIEAGHLHATLVPPDRPLRE